MFETSSCHLPLHVAALGAAKGHDTFLGKHVEGNWVNTLLVDNEKRVVIAFTDLQGVIHQANNADMLSEAINSYTDRHLCKSERLHQYIYIYIYIYIFFWGGGTLAPDWVFNRPCTVHILRNQRCILTCTVLRWSLDLA